MKTAEITVTLYVETQTLTGFLHLYHGQRLSDLLNSVSLTPDESRDQFLELSDVTISQAYGAKQIMSTTHINKATIQLVVVPDGDSARGIGAKVGPKTYPFVQKTPVQVRLHMPGYELTGDIHCASGQKAWNLLDERMMFLPVTNARIRALDKDMWRTAPFAAVNRGQIFWFQHEELSVCS